MTAMLATSAAQADNSVTLYGRMDNGVTYITNTGGQHEYKMDSGVVYSNYWGLRGVEDLGGGTQAIFDLRSGFRVTDGSSKPSSAYMFGKTALVGLSNSFGTLTLGRQYDFINDYTSRYNISQDGDGYAIHLGDLDRMSGDTMINSVKFASKSFNGLSAGGMYSFSNTAGSFHTGSAWSAGVLYATGSFSAAAAYSQLNSTTIDPYNALGLSSFLGTTTAKVSSSTGQLTSLYSSTGLTVSHLDTGGIGASYSFDQLTIKANTTLTKITSADGKVSSFMHVYEAGSAYQFSPALALRSGYQYTTFEHHHWNELSIGLYESLSKSTRIYTSAGYLRASSGVNAVIGYAFTPSSTQTQAALRVGIAHNF
ncbi:porin [Caballeronia sp. SEWSISQ10-4 2]|uniref:porin n=1 Tax=Caballeronia sp. SEWSISQ10-4 2 TaxID=2937438 RepID=UPI0026517B65|nr:porin [Caballeronia sp. SEWSISQ10-4 2]MDN7183130.1 porin [Caballeronia sp. SEWSISQ10-4 2]